MSEKDETNSGGGEENMLRARRYIAALGQNLLHNGVMIIDSYDTSILCSCTFHGLEKLSGRNALCMYTRSSDGYLQ